MKRDRVPSGADRVCFSERAVYPTPPSRSPETQCTSRPSPNSEFGNAPALVKRCAAIIIVVLATACLAHRGGSQGAEYAPLEVFTNGPGRISPLHAGQMLEVWRTYSMEAIPDPGFKFHSWESVDVFIQTARVTNGAIGVLTNVQKTVTSRNRFFTRPELIFTARPVFVSVQSDQLTTTSAYGWRANFGPVREPVEPDVYRTIPGAVAEERGDRVPNGSRVVPLSATLTFDFSTTPPSVTAVISNAVLEGGEPFPLTVRSYYGYQLTNGTYRFSGDYLGDISPTGSQYGFDWEFSAPTNGRVTWNGTAGWMGGHIWCLSVPNLILLPQAQCALRSWPAGHKVDFASRAFRDGGKVAPFGRIAATQMVHLSVQHQRLRGHRTDGAVGRVPAGGGCAEG